MSLPLKGITVLEFSQYLSGPSAGLRLADLGARVIKIERPATGDACRRLVIDNRWIGDTSLLFHTINRNKESFAADLKKPEDLAWVKKLIARADILAHNFRPGVMEAMQLDYESVKKINAGIIYTEISGYGKKGPWSKKPGQDLLVQAISGLAFCSGNHEANPVPFGLAIEDYLCGSQAVQAILAALIRRKKLGIGAQLELSLLETAIDFQFEFFTTYFQTRQQPQRSAVNNAHPLLSAPYGIYQTADSHIAVAMMPLEKLNAAIECEALNRFQENEAFQKRNEIKNLLAAHFLTATTGAWLQKMQQHGLWVMPVLNWNQLRETSTYRKLQMEQELDTGTGKFITTRCPIRIDNRRFFSPVPAPPIGAHTEKIKQELTNEMI